MKKITPKTLSGFMELLPQEQIIFDRMKDIITKTYESFAFTPIDTPALELAPVLLAKAGGETEAQIYRFNKGDTDICMRFDLTVPLSRYVAGHQNELTFPFRRYQIAKVYRGERPQKGRLREFYQADIDIIGSEKLSVLNDAEIPAIMYHTLIKLGLKRFHINISNRKIATGFYQHLGLENMAADILRLIDKIDKIGVENVKLGLQDFNLSPNQIDSIINFINLSGTANDIITALHNLKIDNDTFTTGVAELSTVVEALAQLGVHESHYKINLKITRGLDYYTGTVYETFADDYPAWGSICSGGRYDNLASHYTDRNFPGVGMSIGLSRLFDLLRGENLVPNNQKTSADILIIPMDENQSLAALNLATKLRAFNINCEVYTANTKFKNKMVYANKIAVPFTIILGQDEVASSTFIFKNMLSGTQETLSTDDLAPCICAIAMHIASKATPIQEKEQ